MALLKVCLVLVLVAATMAKPAYNDLSGGGGQNQPESPPIYMYQYSAEDAGEGTQFGHAEQRDGTSSSGEYRVLLPDGRTQVVTYTVEGDSGYVAKVSYEGTANQGGGQGGYH